MNKGIDLADLKLKVDLLWKDHPTLSLPFK